MACLVHSEQYFAECIEAQSLCALHDVAMLVTSIVAHASLPDHLIYVTALLSQACVQSWHAYAEAYFSSVED